MSMTPNATASRETEPNTLPHEIHCACCPREVTIQTRIYPFHRSGSASGTVEFCEPQHALSSISVNVSEYQDFIRGLLLEVTCAQCYAWLKKHELPTETTPHGRRAYRLPHFALKVGMVVWVCPTCNEIFRGLLHKIEQYLDERRRASNDLGLRFRISSSSEG